MNIKKFLLVIALLLSCVQISYSWNEKVTHKDLSRIAAENAVLGLNANYLKNLGYQNALDEKFQWNGRSLKVKEWFQEGAELEDKSSPLFPLSGTGRSLNHFHNPLKPWAQSGLDDWFISHYAGESSLLWAQDGSNQQNVVEGDWSWQKTREYYSAALTSLNDSERQANFAKTFRGLGHQMHLLQDTAVPDHVRNDAHPEDSLMKKNLSGSKYFETWAKDQSHYINTLASDPVFASVSFTTSNNDLSPVARLFDSDHYQGSNPSATLTQGLAEYTNANFFSGDTIFAAERYAVDDRHYFPFPKRSSTDMQSFISGTKSPEKIIAEDGKEDTGIWISKITDGEQIGHFVRPSYLTTAVYEILGEGSKYYSTFYRDERCHEDYAQKLIPRAVGYSAGMLNYFFRGTIEIVLPDSGVYSFSDDPVKGFSKITLFARNNTPNGDEMSDGSIELVVKYRIAQADPFQSYPVPTTDDFSYTVLPVANNVRSIPKLTPAELTFDAGQNTLIPVNATDVFLLIVYKGKLGEEDVSVTVGFKDISEPTPVDLFNNMDKICLNGSWYTAGSPEAIAQVDTDQDGNADEWDVFHHATRDAYLKISSVSNPVHASPSDYTFFVPLISPGDLYRAFILSDYGNSAFHYSNYAPVVETDERDTFIHPPVPENWGKSGAAIKNQVDYHIESQQECSKVGASVPCDIRYYPLLYPFRGRNLWGPAGFIMDNPKYPEDANCSWESLRD
jgi:ribosomal protein S16